MDGLSQYILNVVSRLPQHDEWQYHIVVRPGECPESYLNLWRERGFVIYPAPIAPIGPKREGQFRKWLRTHGPFDAALVPSNQYPTALRIPTVYVIHDIIYERFPSQLGRLAGLKRQWLHHNVARGLRQAAQVVAVSRFTKSEVLRFHPKADANKISVVYEGWEHLQQRISPVAVDVPFREYILYIGSSRGHKNLSGLLNALAIARDKLPQHTGLVIAGDDSMLSEAQKTELSGMKDCVITTGWLSQAQLDACYRHAKAVIFPSLCEGFGIPVLEAFYYHKPLLVSNTSSLPEVAGDAGIYFDPTQPEDIAAKMLYVLNMPPEEQQTLIRKGEARLNAFSWQTTANEIDKLISNLIL